MPYKQRVGGSSPSTPTKIKAYRNVGLYFFKWFKLCLNVSSRKALILALKDSAAAFVLRLSKKLRILK